VKEGRHEVLAACLLVVMTVVGGNVVEAEKALKVFISIDMEGVTGVANWEDVERDGKDYPIFREIMTREANAAVEGAAAAGAREIWVRDSHGTGRNILPEMLDRRAILVREWSGGPKSMMEGIDESFDAAIFVGYHAKAGTPNSLLEHTSSGKVTDFSVNGMSMPEAGYNALIAGLYGVPVVFVAGDLTLCEQITALLGDIETVAVKHGIGAAEVSPHPEVTREMINAGVEKALLRLGDFKPYRLDTPYTLVVKLKDEEMVQKGSHYPGVTRTGEWELTFTSDDFLEIMKAFSYVRR
jgi:D-amino peptidase